jgi:hypothetical protein
MSKKINILKPVKDFYCFNSKRIYGKDEKISWAG